jgi:hypothetical protein
MKLAFISIASAALAFSPATPALAQASGTQVVDTSGAAVGTVVRLDGANKTSFTPNEGKLLFGMTQAQLNAEVEKSLAEAAAAVAPGATVKGSGGTVVGTIEAVEADLVTIKLQSGNLVRIPRSGVAGSNGEVVIGMTAQELEAQVAPATGGGQ